MDTFALADLLLSGYGSTLGLPQVHFDPNGCARLEYTDGLAVVFVLVSAASVIHVYHCLGEIPDAASAAFFRRLLEGNFFGKETRGATLAIDPVKDELLVCRQLPLEGAAASDAEKFMADFLASARDWRQKHRSGELVRDTLPRDGAAAQSQWMVRG